ncbi:VCBS repeat-containing protein [Pyxidicoccus parkwayensis]|uniref:VCBS repeat-containing protein n=1 Tax=Pyxidicoccus parkwayensis TaxID=2813578 RepID=A0ABX7NWT8_9BACT|nr:RHS repeat-associated core domain-containing protein [Pyxidicoccus parkwaysis]QSQ22933.1 VCBS repeat-containing protein [Pyxidicoccus parkwaysis]
MKRILSVLTLVAYCTQMAVSCGYALDAPGSQEFEGPASTTHVRLTGDQELPTPQDVVVRSELSGDGLVPGVVAGGLSVTPDGAATYHVPLWVPQGRAGVQPSLALDYNSRSGNGLLGVGWNLSGLSQVVRCNKTLAQDGAPAPVRFDSTDAFCLDGKRLLQLGNTSAGEKTYTTEVEEFSHIVAHQEDTLGPLWFEVQLKNGLVLEYGREGASRIEGYRMRFEPVSSDAMDARVVGNHTAQSVRYGWSLSRVRDRHGNYMLVEYELRAHGSASTGFGYEQLPVAIRYTGSSTDSTVATPRRSVLFYYKPTERPDRIEGYVSGFRLVSVRLLESIHMWGPGWGTGPMRRYKLGYHNNSVSGRSLLEKLEECDANGDCKRPTIFSWELGTPGTGRVEQVPPIDPYFLRVKVSSALPYIAGSSGYPDTEGFYPAPDFWTLQALDVNGDGRDDLIYRFSPLISGKLQPPRWYLRLNTNGRDFGPATELLALSPARAGDGADDLRTVDLNNDGKVDVVNLFLPDTQSGINGEYRPFLSNGTGFTEMQGDTFDFWFDQSSPVRVPPLHVADLDGNGLPDMVRSVTQGTSGSPFPREWAARLTQVDAQGTPVFPSAHQRTGVAAGLDHAGYAVDVDGDGAMELLVREPDSATADDYSRFLVALGRTASGTIGKKLTTTLSTLPVPNSTYVNFIYRQHWFMDINGDGLPDSVSAKRQPQGQDDAGNIEISINTGNGFSPPVTQVLPAGAEVSFSRRDPRHRFIDVGVRVMDFNMDGKQDLLLTDGGYGVSLRDKHVVLESTGTGFIVRPLKIPVGQSTGYGNVISVSTEDPSKTSLKGSGWGMKFTQLLDANGDGLTDIIQMEEGELVLYVRTSYKPDLLKKVEDGFQNEVTVSYDSVTYGDPSYTAAFHTPATCTWPQSCNMRGQWLVWRHVERGAGLHGGIDRDFLYTYEGGRTDLRGRGWLGFAKRTVQDVDASQETTSLYRNDKLTQGFYLEAHRPYEETTKVVLEPGNVDFFRRTTEFSSRSTAGGRGIFPYVSKVSELEVSGDYGTLRYQESADQYDTYGNLTLHEEVAKDGTRLVTSTTYDNYPVQGDHLLGLQRRQMVTSTTPAGQSVTRTKELQYCDGALCQPTSNLPRRLITEPDAVSPEWEDVRLETVFTYNGLGLPTQVVSTDAAGRKRRMEHHYDAYERMLPVAQIVYPTDDPNGPVLRTDYAYLQGMGLPAVRQNPNGLQTRWFYDAFGRPRAENGPDAGDFTVSYSEENGLPLVTTREVNVSTCGANAYGLNFATCTPNGTEAQVRYDSLGREFLRRTRGFNGEWMVVDTEYDGLGRVEKVSMPHTILGPVLKKRFEYDKRGRLRFAYNPDGTYQEKLYQGLRTLHWDEKRNQAILVEDDLGRVVQSTNVTSTGNVLTRYEYGPFGLPRYITDTAGNRTELEYDRLGRRTLLNDPDSGVRQTAYTAFGDVRWQTDGNGNTVTHTYDGLGRTLTEANQPPAGGTAQVTTFVWDTAPNGLGALHTATSPDGVVQAYEYDTLSRPAHERWSIQGQEYRLSRTYDAQGRLQTVGYPEVAGRARMGVLYNYNLQGDVQSVQDINTGHTYWMATSRNASGLLTGESFGNGVNSTRRYDALNQLRFIETSGPSGDVQRLAYDYEANGNLRTRVDRLLQVTEDFQYDALDRLTQWKVSKGCNNAAFTYEYDAMGNLSYRTSKLGNSANAPIEAIGYIYGAGPAGPHAVTSAGADAYAYDNNGNLNRRQLGVGGLRELGYTYFNLPKKATEGARQWMFGYDAGHQRAFKQSNDGARTVYAGGLYEKRTKPDGTTSHIFYVAGPERVVAQVEWTDVPTPGTTVVAYLHLDHLGSVESVTTDGGMVVAHHKYDPFGLRKNPTNPALPFIGSATNLRLGFTGHEEDDEVGLINMKGRMYDPKLARFLSPDPVVQAPFFGQSLNRYSYVLNNPLRFTDPTGFQAVGPTTEVHPESAFEPEVFVAGEREREPLSDFWRSGPGMSVEPVVGAADPNGSRISGLEKAVYGVNGLLTGVAMGMGTAYALGALSAVCPPCAVAAGVGLLAYGVYGLVNGGAKALWDSGERIVQGRGTASDFFGVGAAIGGLASGKLAKPAFLTGQAHGALAVNAVQSTVAAATGVRLRVGQEVQPMERTLDMALDPEVYAYAVARRYGINLRGSRKTITLKFNPSLVSEGKSRQATPTVIEFGPRALRSEADLANTLAHELNHARSWLKGGKAPEPQAYAAGDALEEFIWGLR